jgi:hypothetical protein
MPWTTTWRAPVRDTAFIGGLTPERGQGRARMRVSDLNLDYIMFSPPLLPAADRDRLMRRTDEVGVGRGDVIFWRKR